jgi:hypothetical protein
LQGFRGRGAAGRTTHLRRRVPRFVVTGPDLGRHWKPASAVGEGAMAVQDVHRYLAGLEREAA